MLVAGEGEKINSKQYHMYQADNSIIKSQLFLFLFVCAQSFPQCKGLLLLLLLLFKTPCVYYYQENQPQTNKIFPCKVSWSTNVYIKSSYFLVPLPFFPLSPPHSSVCRIYLKKKDGQACKIFVCASPPSSPDSPHTSLQVCGSTLHHKNWKGEQTSRH